MSFYSGTGGKVLFNSWNFAWDDDGDGDGDFQPGDVVNEDNLIEAAKVLTWSITHTSNLLDTTTLGEWDKNNFYGVRTTTGNIEFFYFNKATSGVAEQDQSSPRNNDASRFIAYLNRPTQQQTVNPTADTVLGISRNPRREPESLPVHLRLFLRETKARQIRDFISFDARLSSISYGIAVDDVVKVSASFEAYGRINWSNL